MTKRASAQGNKSRGARPAPAAVGAVEDASAPAEPAAAPPPSPRRRRAAAEPVAQQATGALIGMPAELVEKFLEVMSARSGSDPAMVEMIRAHASTTQELTKEFKRQVIRQNAESQDESPFTYDARCPLCLTRQQHPETGKIAHPKPQFAFSGGVFFCHNKIDWEASTILEVDLINQFVGKGSRTAHKGTWTCNVGKDGIHDRLEIIVPFQGMDARSDLPHFVQVLTELLFGEEMGNPINQMAMIRELQTKIEQLTRMVAEKSETVGA